VQQKTYEDLDTWHRDDSGLKTLLGELLHGLDTERDLGTGRDDGDVGILGVLENVTTLGSLLDGRVGELGKLYVS
jgi:hypothetical protein